MKQDNIIFETADVHLLETEQYVSRFNNIAHEYFQVDLGFERDNLTRIKESAKFFGYQLPASINDYFIGYPQAPLFWITTSPLSLFLEDFFKAHLSKGSGLDYHHDIKNFYSRWALVNSKEEKKYFAASAIKTIEKNTNKHNFFDTILHAVFLALEDSLFNPEKAIELFEKANEKVSALKINENRKEELHYLISIYCGFVNLKQKKYKEAKQIFENALIIRPAGVTATFNIAYADIKLHDNSSALRYLKEILLFDISRVSYALSQNNLAMFNFFSLNSVFSNIFQYKEFAIIFSEIENLINEKKNSVEIDVDTLKNQIRNFLSIKFEGVQADIVGDNVIFLEKLINSFSGVKNIFFLSSIDNINSKFKTIVKNLETEVKGKYAKEIEERMGLYDLEITEKSLAAENLKKDLEDFKSRIKEKLQDEISAIEKMMSHDIGILEDRIKNLHMEPKLDPVTSFKNTMTYNFILALMVFLIGGFAGYSSVSLGGSSDFNSLTAIIMVNGIKWALLSFLVGVVIASVVSGSVVVERGNVKQRLLQRISILKTRKEQQVEELKSESQRKEKRTSDSFTKKITDLKELVENIRIEKERQRGEMQSAAEEKVKTETEILQAFL